MKRTKSPILPIPVDRGLKSLIEVAARKTRLCQADVMRSALRVGVPEVVRRHEAFAGLVQPGRELVAPSRFK
jgi:hypothetical protein